jgi:tetratricopeptide (TPR) repeat protein
MIYRNAGDIDRALPHYRESIRYEEAQGNVYGAARTRFNVALALAHSGRVADAREYARAALRNFETYGAGVAQDIRDTQQLLATLDARPQ